MGLDCDIISPVLSKSSEAEGMRDVWRERFDLAFSSPPRAVRPHLSSPPPRVAPDSHQGFRPSSLWREKDRQFHIRVGCVRVGVCVCMCV